MSCDLNLLYEIQQKRTYFQCLEVPVEYYGLVFTVLLLTLISRCSPVIAVYEVEGNQEELDRLHNRVLMSFNEP